MIEGTWPWAAALLILLLLLATAYWIVVITEGTYLGSALVALLYDRFARRYDAIKEFVKEDEYYFIARPLLLGFELTGVAHPLVLDVATGTGRVPRALIEAASHSDLDETGEGVSHAGSASFSGQVVAIDRSLGMLQEAVKGTPEAKPISWLWKDASQLPFPDGIFDAVCCLEALEFTPDPRQIMRELVRVLRPGGFLLTSNRVGWEAYLFPGRTFRRPAFRLMLAEMGMGTYDVKPWQVDYDWAFARKAGEDTGNGHGRLPLNSILCCPRCRARRWAIAERLWTCGSCGCAFAYRDHILRLEQGLPLE